MSQSTDSRAQFHFILEENEAQSLTIKMQQDVGSSALSHSAVFGKHHCQRDLITLREGGQVSVGCFREGRMDPPGFTG